MYAQSQFTVTFIPVQCAYKLFFFLPYKTTCRSCIQIYSTNGCSTTTTIEYTTVFSMIARTIFDALFPPPRLGSIASYVHIKAPVNIKVPSIHSKFKHIFLKKYHHTCICLTSLKSAPRHFLNQCAFLILNFSMGLPGEKLSRAMFY